VYDEGEQVVAYKDIHEKAEDKPGHRALSSYSLPKWVYHPQQAKRRIYVERADFYGMAADGTRNYEGWNVAHVACFHDDLKMLSMATLEECSEVNKWGMTPAHMCGLGSHVYGPSVHTLYELVQMGAANPEALNLGEQTPWHVAQRMHKAADLKTFQNILMKGTKPSGHDAKKAAALKARGKFAKALQAGTMKTCLVFPGPESVYVGMLKDVSEQLPSVQQMLNQAKEMLGLDIASIIFNGPMAELKKPNVLLPATFIAGLAAAEKLGVSKSGKVEDCFATLGQSIGEYCALTVAGVFSFQTGLRLLQSRAEAMTSALGSSPEQAGITVAGLSKEVVERICKSAGIDSGKVCEMSQHLFQKGFSVTGDADAVAAAKAAFQKESPSQMNDLSVMSIHNSRLSSIRPKLTSLLQQAQMTGEIQAPRCRVYLNSTGAAIAPDTPLSAIVEAIVAHAEKPVLWYESVTAAIRDGCNDFVECGPHDQLYRMMRLISPQVHKDMSSVTV